MREFVMSFGRLLPLHKPSPLSDKAIIQKFMVHSGGLTGRITSLLAQAAELAIRQKTESISLDSLIDAAEAGVFRSRPNRRSMTGTAEAFAARSHH
jgi:transcription initiation factor TFIIIB Brf1 subunit/transcription initiation factor TFIIB